MTASCTASFSARAQPERLQSHSEDQNRHKIYDDYSSKVSVKHVHKTRAHESNFTEIKGREKLIKRTNDKDL